MIESYPDHIFIDKYVYDTTVLMLLNDVKRHHYLIGIEYHFETFT